MNDRYSINSSLVRDWLAREARKHSFVSRELGVSDALVDKILAGHVPKERTLKALAQLMGVGIETLLIPKEAKVG